MHDTIKFGKYKHYKNNFYELLYIANHSETEEQLAIYRKLYGDGSIWARPLDMFFEEINIDGIVTPRFTYVDDNL